MKARLRLGFETDEYMNDGIYEICISYDPELNFRLSRVQILAVLLKLVFRNRRKICRRSKIFIVKSDSIPVGRRGFGCT